MQDKAPESFFVDPKDWKWIVFVDDLKNQDCFLLKRHQALKISISSLWPKNKINYQKKAEAGKNLNIEIELNGGHFVDQSNGLDIKWLHKNI